MLDGHVNLEKIFLSHVDSACSVGLVLYTFDLLMLSQDKIFYLKSDYVLHTTFTATKN